MKIPIKEAINSGAWFNCKCGYDATDEYDFKLKVLSFDKINLGEIDNPEKIDIDLASGVLWLMKMQIISLNKTAVIRSPKYFIYVIDQDDFVYNYINDSYLALFSNYARLSGLYNFFAVNFMPKIKYTGAIAFYLPDENEAEYYISVEGGNIQEV